MLFKHERDANQYRRITGRYAGEGNLILRIVLEVLDKISQLFGYGEVTVTSYIRQKKGKNDPSLHPHARAADLRTHDKPKIWYTAMVALGKALEALSRAAAKAGLTRYWVHINPHLELRGTPDAHIHIEIREWRS